MALMDILHVLVCFFRRMLHNLLSPLLVADGLCALGGDREKRQEDEGPPPLVAEGDCVLVDRAGASAARLTRQAIAAGAAEVVVVVEDGSSRHLDRLRKRFGSEQTVRFLHQDDVQHAAAEYDVILVDASRGLVGEPKLLRPGGVVVISGARAPSLLRSLAPSCLATPGRAGDGSEWLATDVAVERRISEGWLRETVIARRYLGGAEATHAAIERLRRLYGSCSMSYCTSPGAGRVGEPEKDLRFYLRGQPGAETGCVAYVEQVVMGARLRCVIMDPLAAPGELDGLLRGFVRSCKASRARPLFTCVSASLAESMAALGFHTTKLGAEIAVPLRSYVTPKERRRYLRTGASKGLEVFQKCYDFEELDQLNDDWLSHKACGHEVSMWTWPPSMPRRDIEQGNVGQDDDEVRRLFAYLDGELVGFVCAEPFYRDDGTGKLLGYGLNTIRFRPNVNPSWASDFTIAALIEQLQAEGEAEYLAFGLSPFTELCRRPGDTWFLSGLFELMWDANFDGFYNLFGLAKKKAHHCSGQGVRLEERLICGPRGTAISDFFRFMAILVAGMSSRMPAEAAAIVCRTCRRIVGHAVRFPCRCWRALGRRSGSITQGGRRAQQATIGVGLPPNTESAEAFITCILLTVCAVPLGIAALAAGLVCAA